MIDLGLFQAAFLHLGPLGVFLGSFAGEIIGPMPAISIIAGAGFAVVRHIHFSMRFIGDVLILIALPDAFGATLGSFVTYSIGYWGGKPIIVRWGKYFGVTWARIEKIQQRLVTTNKDEWLLFIVRALPLFPNIAINITCGLIQMPKGRYALVTFWGTFIRATIYALIGWSLGGAYKKYAHVVNRFEQDLFLFVIVAIVTYILWRLYRNNKKNKSDTI